MKPPVTKEEDAIINFFKMFTMDDVHRNLDDTVCMALQDEFYQQTAYQSMAMIIEIKYLLQILSPKNLKT